MNKILELSTSDKVKGVIALISAVVMYFTPDYIDTIIETLLAGFGVSSLVIHKKDECK